MAKARSALQDISPDRIRRNPSNPRLIFRETEMNELLDSINEVGIKVPISVYQSGSKFYLLDGERRWRCARKLNLPAMPAIVQPKPSKLENLLMMFNIHNVRVDWDLMPMALKLKEVRDMLERDGKSNKAKDLAGITGMSLPTVRRALELLELPKKYRTMLLREAEKPRDQQEVTVDLFVEINKSKRAIDRHAPEVFTRVSKSRYVDAMVGKYKTGVVNNVVRFRDISKIARAKLAGGSREQVIPILVRLVRNPVYTIEKAYARTVEAAYIVRDLTSRAEKLAEKLAKCRRTKQMPEPLRGALVKLKKEINRLIG